MGIGKQLALAKQFLPAGAPAFSYKTLRRLVKHIAAQQLSHCAAESPGASGSADPINTEEDHSKQHGQHEFFKQLDEELSAARSFVETTTINLEAMVGEWQTFAVDAGLLFTPAMLQQVSESVLPGSTLEDAVRIITSLTPAAKTIRKRHQLVEAYSKISQATNKLLFYIETSLAAILDLLAMFSKQIAVERHLRSVPEYLQHRQFKVPAFETMLLTMFDIERLFQMVGVSRATPGFVPLHVGPKCSTLLAQHPD
eukprot:TRINITY_DN45474_c0_g1_i1.p1 TRINITY_DN45474_c0_g1~~TRINITY_DN45474_c0_g1_i1.p1  ORF type:complete len:267 (+),score=48.23 TRINITY_DN45474_c0_g1_i1:38-802(+)